MGNAPVIIFLYNQFFNCVHEFVTFNHETVSHKKESSQWYEHVDT